MKTNTYNFEKKLIFFLNNIRFQISTITYKLNILTSFRDTKMSKLIKIKTFIKNITSRFKEELSTLLKKINKKDSLSEEEIEELKYFIEIEINALTMDDDKLIEYINKLSEFQDEN